MNFIELIFKCIGFIFGSFAIAVITFFILYFGYFFVTIPATIFAIWILR